MKHAYCIIAHKDIYTLNKLLECIDDKRNDIFLLLDKKSLIDKHDIYQPINSSIIIKQSITIRWGDISQIKAELAVLKAASSNGSYSYYHLVSGQDLPLHNQDFIHHYCSSVKPETNFIGYAQGSSNKRSLEERISYYVPFTAYYKISNKYLRIIFETLRNKAVNIQKRFGIIRTRPSIEFQKGCNWATMTDKFVKHLLNHENNIITLYRYTPCCDEIYKQTIAWNSIFKDTLYDSDDEYNGCVREIDWNRGGPYTYRQSDLNQLLSSDKLFARKFDSQIDKQIIDELVSNIKKS